MGVPLGGCERIQGTPLPFVYVAHLRSFLLFYLLGIPFIYVCSWQWATIPLSMVIAFALLGIEAASVECARPSTNLTRAQYGPIAQHGDLPDVLPASSPLGRPLASSHPQAEHQQAHPQLR